MSESDTARPTPEVLDRLEALLAADLSEQAEADLYVAVVEHLPALIAAARESTPAPTEGAHPDWYQFNPASPLYRSGYFDGRNSSIVDWIEARTAPASEVLRQIRALVEAANEEASMPPQYYQLADEVLALLAASTAPAAEVAPTNAEALRTMADDLTLMEVARKAVEDELVEFRDSRLSMLRNNGLVIKERDGTDSNVIRFGTETAIRIGLRAIADRIEADA